MVAFFCMAWLNTDKFLSRLGMNFQPKPHAFPYKGSAMAKLSSCSSAVKPRRRRRCRAKVRYRFRNWLAYNAGLKQRCDLTVWLPSDLAEVWYYQAPQAGGAIYLFFGRGNFRHAALASLADAHGVIGPSPLDHLDSFY